MAEDYPSSTTIPSSPTAPSPHPDKPTSPRPTPQSTTLRKFRILLLRSLSCLAHKTDHDLIHLSRLLSTPRGIDVLLCTTSYTLTLTHALLSRLLERKLADIADAIAKNADGILLPGETLVASLPAPTSTKVLARIVGSTKALSSTIADFRVFVRLWGVVGLYTWARTTYLSPLPASVSSKDKVLRQLTWAAIASCIGFQVLENGAYLSSKGALTSARWTGDVGKARENDWWLWSSRFWAAYVGIELVRLGVVRFYASEQALDDGEKEDKLRRREEKWVWWRDFVSNVAYAPMTLHWSIDGGLLSDWGVGACGMVAGGALLVDAWRQTR